MSPALPGTRDLFSTLQDALSKGDRRRVRINRHDHATAADFKLLVNYLSARPTRLQELVPTAPVAVGACDACQKGMCGVWLFSDDNAPPALACTFLAPISLVATNHGRAPQRQHINLRHGAGWHHCPQGRCRGPRRHSGMYALDCQRPSSCCIVVDKRLFDLHHCPRLPPLVQCPPSAAPSLCGTAPLYSGPFKRNGRQRQSLLGFVGQCTTSDPFQCHLPAGDLLAAASPSVRDQLCSDWCALETTAARRHSRQRGANSCTSWNFWSAF